MSYDNIMYHEIIRRSCVMRTRYQARILARDPPKSSYKFSRYLRCN